MTDSAAKPVFESEVDWEAARAFLRRRLAAELKGTDITTVEDLTQEALVRLLRVLRREGARHLEGLMSEIARRTAKDFIRAKVRWTHYREAIARHSESEPAASARPAGLGDPLANLRFVVLEFFGGRASPCRDLAQVFFEEEKWEAVALKLGRSHDAIRKQWSRCLQELRTAAERDPDFLWSFTDAEENRDG